MSSKPSARGKSSRSTKEPRYIGISIQQFLDGAAQDAKAGRYDDGTTIKPKTREALTRISKSFGDTQLQKEHYVFCFSSGCFVVVDYAL